MNKPKLFAGNRPYPLYECDEFYTLPGLLERCCGKFNDKPVFRWANSRGITAEVTYGGFLRDIKRLCGFLANRYRGAHIAIFGANSYEWLLCFFAITCSGNVAVPIDKDQPPETVAALANKADCDAIFLSDDYTEEASLVDIPDGDRYLFSAAKALGDTTAGEFKKEIGTNDDAAIFFTSGTGGLAKGVLLTHGNLARNVTDILKSITGPADTLLLLPLHHTFGITAGVLCQFALGSCIFINQSYRYITRDLQLSRPGNLVVVPLLAKFLYKGIFDSAEKSGEKEKLQNALRLSENLLKLGIDLRRRLFKSVIDGLGGRLEFMVVGGAPIDPDVWKGVEDFGIKVLNGFGITECSPVVAVTRNRHKAFGTVGSVLPESRVTIDSPDANGDGEIIVCGPSVAKGYYKGTPEENAAFDGGRFRTGDIGRFTGDGFLKLTGRLKNLIITQNGENICPEEIEERILTIPEVAETVVYAVDDVITAEIYPAGGDVSKETTDRIRQEVKRINNTLPTVKKVGKTIFRSEEFPKTTTMKIKRHGI